ncbi:alpha/beta hydrolase [Leekyejoonella antrihumi]|uniref:Alpha/beta hydrolase n=1 Tax=Leekyejoonella antrihumi TaxID=1660198 RepID=A0A563DVN5_9MICO|nr:alpha/beta hydrolase [Leekyejoonella antrihumi]TWP34328.1 alpha/beta hydrolase [Leekyejoonella antrihumi]
MAPVPSIVAPSPDSTITYGAHPDQVYDVRLPSGPARGCTVVVVHGGFWRPEYDRTHAAGQANAFSTTGFHVAAIEYRRAPRGGWPDMSSDVRAALDAVRKNSDLPRPTVLVGHSAGGHLAAWLLHQPEGAGLLGAVSLAGCLDLLLVERLELGDGAARDLLGGEPASDPAGWSAADPAQLGIPPTPLIVLHGTVDERVPLEVSQSYASRFPTPQGRVELQVLDGCTHFDLIDPASRYFAATVDAAMRLTRRT